jgi:hypothetical protein
MVVPYITAWSEEPDPPCIVMERPEGGIGYTDETLADRDRHGVLWLRTLFRPGEGRPLFGKVHPVRQRRAMQRLLCQVCAKPANQADDGVLWVLRDFQEDWPAWPNGMAAIEPPICLPCVRLSMRLCPSLRKGAAVIRARSYRAAGVRGLLYGRDGHTLRAVSVDVTVMFEDSAIHWVRASCLVRELQNSVIIPLGELADE